MKIIISSFKKSFRKTFQQSFRKTFQQSFRKTFQQSFRKTSIIIMLCFGFMASANPCVNIFNGKISRLISETSMKNILEADKKLTRHLKKHLINEVSMDGNTLLHVAIANKSSFSQIEYLIALGANPYISNNKEERVIETKYFSHFMNSILSNKQNQPNQNKKTYRIYFAGPEVFLSFHKNVKDFINVQVSIFNRHKLQKETYQIKGIFPLDNEISKNNKKITDSEFTDSNKESTDPSFNNGLQIYESNIKLLDLSDGLVANTVIFRGSGMDPGTAFEVGYIKAKNGIVINYYDENPFYQDARPNRTNIRKYEQHFGIPVTKQGSLFDDNNLEIENFNMSENLMIVGAGETQILNNAWEALEALQKRISKK